MNLNSTSSSSSSSVDEVTSSSAVGTVVLPTSRRRARSNTDEDDDKEDKQLTLSAAEDLASFQPSRKRLTRRPSMEVVLDEVFGSNMSWKSNPFQFVAEYAFSFSNRWAVDFDVEVPQIAPFARLPFVCRFDEHRMILVLAWSVGTGVFEFHCYDLTGKRVHVWPDRYRTPNVGLHTFVGIDNGRIVMFYRGQPGTQLNTCFILSRNGDNLEINTKVLILSTAGKNLIGVSSEGIWIPLWKPKVKDTTFGSEKPLVYPLSMTRNEYEEQQQDFRLLGYEQKQLQMGLLSWNGETVHVFQPQSAVVPYSYLVGIQGHDMHFFQPPSRYLSAHMDHNVAFYVHQRSPPTATLSNQAFGMIDGSVLYTENVYMQNPITFQQRTPNGPFTPLFFADVTRPRPARVFTGKNATPPPPLEMGEHFQEAYRVDPDFAAFVPICVLYQQCAVVVAAVSQDGQHMRMSMFL